MPKLQVSSTNTTLLKSIQKRASILSFMAAQAVMPEAKEFSAAHITVLLSVLYKLQGHYIRAAWRDHDATDECWSNGALLEFPLTTTIAVSTADNRKSSIEIESHVFEQSTSNLNHNSKDTKSLTKLSTYQP